MKNISHNIVLASMMLTGCKQYVEEDNIDKNNKTNVSSEVGDEVRALKRVVRAQESFEYCFYYIRCVK